MRKSYIGWWIAAGFCLLCAVNSVNTGYYYGDNSYTVGLFGLLAIIFFFSGHSRYRAYKEYQHDREVRNQFYQSQNQNVSSDPTRFVRVTHSEYKPKTPEPTPAHSTTETTADQRAVERQTMKSEKEEKEKKREGCVKREFSVAGVSRHQEVFREIGYLNEEYTLSKSRLEEDGLLYEDIPKYIVDTFKLELELDPDNEVDPNAVKVLMDGKHVGYIPADDAEYVHTMIEEDRIADMDAKVVGGPLKRYNDETDKMEKVDLTFGIRLYLYVRKGR